MRIAVMGTGGVGGYFGAKLAAAGEDVAFVARGAHKEAIARNGLRVLSPAGDVHVRPARVTDDPGAIGPCDAVLFAGDDHPDLEAFEALDGLRAEGRSTVKVAVGGAETPDELLEAADVVVDGPEGLAALLASL